LDALSDAGVSNRRSLFFGLVLLAEDPIDIAGSVDDANDDDSVGEGLTTAILPENGIFWQFLPDRVRDVRVLESIMWNHESPTRREAWGMRQ
jgi:hypothetical protein